ncbi:hypothetical protein B0H14DRAFT_3129101 [Mycena olivaceomarginata]|nr:hypothetical protein B0H14DRAFT_3129101 [Mycena olivaceomarginata]
MSVAVAEREADLVFKRCTSPETTEMRRAKNSKSRMVWVTGKDDRKAKAFVNRGWTLYFGKMDKTSSAGRQRTLGSKSSRAQKPGLRSGLRGSGLENILSSTRLRRSALGWVGLGLRPGLVQQEERYGEVERTSRDIFSSANLPISKHVPRPGPKPGSRVFQNRPWARRQVASEARPVTTLAEDHHNGSPCGPSNRSLRVLWDVHLLAEWHAGRGLPTKLAPQTPLAVEVEHLQIEMRLDSSDPGSKGTASKTQTAEKSKRPRVLVTIGAAL